MKVATASQMHELDRRAIEDFHIPGIVLMENAGRATFSFMNDELGIVSGKTVPIFCGPGNNGGDGLVIARYIHQNGGYPYIFFLSNPEKLRGDAGTNYKIIQSLNLPIRLLVDDKDIESLYDYLREISRSFPLWSIVDAIFGTGLKRELGGLFLKTVNTINNLRIKFNCPITSVDIPSGLHSDNGAILGDCILADLTATYGLAKPAHFLHGGEKIGKLKIVDIGIPPAAVQSMNLKGEVLGPQMSSLLKDRGNASHKGSHGHVLILAGSIGKTGAAVLCGLGALHGGAGLVSMIVPRELKAILEASPSEMMIQPLPHSTFFPTLEDYDFIVEQLYNKEVLVVGPGIGTEETTRELIIKLYREQIIPMVLDADALNNLALETECINLAAGPRIFTPHPGEMARLIGVNSKTVQNDRLKAARWISDRAKQNVSHDLITVLKGAGTVCARADGSWAINTSGNPGMASGGMGDVLAGVIGALLAQDYSPWDAARLGVYLHGLAGDILAKKTPYGYLASELAATIPFAVAESKPTNSEI